MDIAGSLVDWFSRLPGLWLYLMVGLLATAESAALVGLAVPGEIVVIFAGYLAHEHRVSLLGIMAVAIAGAIAGDSIGYEMGRRLGTPLKRSAVGRKIGEARWKRAEDFLHRRGGPAIFTGRFVGVVRALVPAVGGMAGMPYPRFLLWNAAGGVVWGVGVVLAGWAAGASWERVSRWIGRGGLIVAAVLVVAVAAFVVIRKLSRRRQESAK